MSRTKKNLHIVSFNIPFPPNYGGIIDIFYKIKYLSENGVKIHLHCYEYGRNKNNILNSYCETVNYYKREREIASFFHKLPYIVITRSSGKLLSNLLKNDFPILFEGLHTTFFLDNEQLYERLKIVRTHNIEHEYYKYASGEEKNLIKKLFFYKESGKLKKYEKILIKSSCVASISGNDFNYFNNKFQNVYNIPAFHPFNTIENKTGTGNYILFHGNLSVNENLKAVKYLYDNILYELKYPVIIAGKDPVKKIVNLVRNHKYSELINNPDDEKMFELINNAQINLIPTFQDTGLKLKLLASLYLGRHCITNSLMVKNTGLAELCSIKDKVIELRNEIERLINVPFEVSQINKREKILLNKYSNRKNIKTLMELF